MSEQVSFRATWGPKINLTNGRIVIDDQTFSLVSNIGLTIMQGSIGKNAYTAKTYAIDSIIGYESNFLAWMAILFSDGSTLKLSIGMKGKKRELIGALEEHRAAIFASRGQVAPPLTKTI